MPYYPDTSQSADSGWLEEARPCPSPNYGPRPSGVPVSLLVIHNISLPPGQFGGGYIERFFTNCLNPNEHEYFRSIADLRVSSHLLITRKGELVQFVGLDDRAWHAGASCFGGVGECNDYSIGIELEGTDDHPYTPAQYECLARTTRDIMRRYPAIVPERITGHSNIAPGRKTDPGPAFDWARYRRSLQTTQ